MLRFRKRLWKFSIGLEKVLGNWVVGFDLFPFRFKQKFKVEMGLIPPPPTQESPLKGLFNFSVIFITNLFSNFAAEITFI